MSQDVSTDPEKADNDTSLGPRLFGDRVDADPQHDRLGRSEWASHIAVAIRDGRYPGGFVFGLHGPWGSGKSTVIEYILRDLRGVENLEVVRFNPWWFSGGDHLLQQFMAQLGAAIERRQGPDAGRQIARFTEKLRSLSPLLALAGKLSNAASVVQEIAEATALLGDHEDIHSVRDDLDEQLRSGGIRYLVVVDDIDRLSASEVPELFKLIKAIADFPNVTYLVAFDREPVLGILDDLHGGKGREYLEKIVQVPLDLPPPHTLALRDMLEEALPEPFTSVGRGQGQRLGDVQAKIAPLINTPRLVFRLANAILAAYPEVAGDVDVADFLALNALRVTHPDFVQRIARLADELTGLPPTESNRENATDHRSLYEVTLGEVGESERPYVSALMSLLFPRWANFAGVEDRPLGREAHREGRIASLEAFPLYFYLAPPDQTLSPSQVRETLGLEEDQFVDRVRSLAGARTLAGRRVADWFLEVAPGFVRDVKPQQVPALVEGLYRVLDLFDSRQHKEVDRFQLELLKRLPSAEERTATLVAGLRKSASVEHAVRTVTWWRKGERSRLELISKGEGPVEFLAKIDSTVRELASDHVESGESVPTVEFLALMEEWSNLRDSVDPSLLPNVLMRKNSFVFLLRCVTRREVDPAARYPQVDVERVARFLKLEPEQILEFAKQLRYDAALHDANQSFLSEVMLVGPSEDPD